MFPFCLLPLRLLLFGLLLLLTIISCCQTYHTRLHQLLYCQSCLYSDSNILKVLKSKCRRNGSRRNGTKNLVSKMGVDKMGVNRWSVIGTCLQSNWSVIGTCLQSNWSVIFAVKLKCYWNMFAVKLQHSFAFLLTTLESMQIYGHHCHAYVLAPVCLTYLLKPGK